MILVVLGSIRLWTARNRFVVVLTLTNLLVFFVLSATWHSWEGGWSWGPRLLLPGVIPTVLLLSPLSRKERRVGIALLAAGFVVSASTIVVSTRAQQLDHPLPSVGPSILRQYQLVPSVTRYTVDHLQKAQLRRIRVDYCPFGKSTSDEFGTKGLLAGIAGSLVLLAGLVVAVRRSPFSRIIPLPAQHHTEQRCAGLLACGPAGSRQCRQHQRCRSRTGASEIDFF